MQETWVWSLGQEYPLEEGNDNPLQYFCLGNPMDREAWKATVHGVVKESRHDLATKQQRLHHVLVCDRGWPQSWREGDAGRGACGALLSWRPPHRLHQHPRPRASPSGSRLAGCCSQSPRRPDSWLAEVPGAGRRYSPIWKVAKVALAEEGPRPRAPRLRSFTAEEGVGSLGGQRRRTSSRVSRGSPDVATVLLGLRCKHLRCSRRRSAIARHLFLLAQPPNWRLALLWLACFPLFLIPVHDNHSSEESLPKDVHWAHKQPYGESAIQVNSHSESTFKTVEREPWKLCQGSRDGKRLV